MNEPRIPFETNMSALTLNEATDGDQGGEP